MSKITPKVKPNDKYTQTNAYELMSLYMESESGGRIDLKPLFQNFTFVEDIFASAMTGSILIKDSVSLLNTFPISGYEKITVMFRTPGIGAKYTKLSFDVVEVNDTVKAPNERGQVYRINFVSPALMKDKLTAISKSVKGKISDIAKEIYSDFIGGELDVQDTKDEYKYIIPRWSPIKTLEWLARRAVPAQQSDETNYVFYEDTEGHHFVSLSKLVSEEPVMTYFSIITNADNSKGTPGKDIAREFSNVKDSIILKTNQKLKEHMGGAFSSTLYVHDVTSKQWGSFVYKYNDDENNVRYVSKNKITKNKDKFVDSPDTKILLTTKQTGVMGEKYPDVQNHSDWLQRSISSKILLESVKIKLTTSGNSLLKAGSVVDFYMPKTSSIKKSDSEWYDTYFSGRYLITTIRHTITPEGYTNTMTISKNSYEKPIPDKSTFMGTSEDNGRKVFR